VKASSLPGAGGALCGQDLEAFTSSPHAQISGEKSMRIRGYIPRLLARSSRLTGCPALPPSRTRIHSETLADAKGVATVHALKATAAAKGVGSTDTLEALASAKGVHSMDTLEALAAKGVHSMDTLPASAATHENGFLTMTVRRLREMLAHYDEAAQVVLDGVGPLLQITEASNVISPAKGDTPAVLDDKGPAVVTLRARRL